MKTTNVIRMAPLSASAAVGSAYRWPDRPPPSARHSAIAGPLSSYMGYRSWAEQMRTAFDHEEAQAEGTPVPPLTRP